MTTKAREILNLMDRIEDPLQEKVREIIHLKKAVKGFTMDGSAVKVPKGDYSFIGNDEARKPNILITDRDYEIFSVPRAVTGVDYS